jgi:hypothetical protein
MEQAKHVSPPKVMSAPSRDSWTVTEKGGRSSSFDHCRDLAVSTVTVTGGRVPGPFQHTGPGQARRSHQVFHDIVHIETRRAWDLDSLLAGAAAVPAPCGRTGAAPGGSGLLGRA